MSAASVVCEQGRDVTGTLWSLVGTSIVCNHLLSSDQPMWELLLGPVDCRAAWKPIVLASAGKHSMGERDVVSMTIEAVSVAPRESGVIVGLDLGWPWQRWWRAPWQLLTMRYRIHQMLRSFERVGFRISDAFVVWPSMFQPRLAFPLVDAEPGHWLHRTGRLGGGQSVAKRLLLESPVAQPLMRALIPAIVVRGNRR